MAIIQNQRAKKVRSITFFAAGVAAVSTLGLTSVMSAPSARSSTSKPATTSTVTSGPTTNDLNDGSATTNGSVGPQTGSANTTSGGS